MVHCSDIRRIFGLGDLGNLFCRLKVYISPHLAPQLYQTSQRQDSSKGFRQFRKLKVYRLKYLKFMESYIFQPDNRRSVRGSRSRFTRAGSWEWWEGWVISAVNCQAIGIRLISIFGQDPPVRKDFSRTVNMKVEFILVIIKY